MLGKHVARVGGERRLELSEHLAFWCVPVLSHVTAWLISHRGVSGAGDFPGCREGVY